MIWKKNLVKERFNFSNYFEFNLLEYFYAVLNGLEVITGLVIK